MFSLLKKVFGTDQTRRFKKYFKIVKNINELEVSYQALSDDELKNKTKEFQERLKNGQTPDDLLVEAYAVVKNTCRRLCGKQFQVAGATLDWDLIPFDVQIAGAIALHHNCISEMQTGEGKTLTAALPLYLHALTGKGVHLVTVNDYLAKRDRQWGCPIFDFHGITSSSLTGDVDPVNRKEIYESDIVYATASELGFDYLRDNSMASKAIEQCQKKPYFAIIDEVDSILIDEARTPLIISGPAHGSRQMYDEMKKPVAALIALQKATCNVLASDANKIMQKLGLLRDSHEGKKLNKEEIKQRDEALEKLWLLSKGMPRHKTLLRSKESPDIRALLDKLDAFYHVDVNKTEGLEKLEALELIVDEHDHSFELTERGMKHWSSNSDDFIMLDLGQEYAKIDEARAPLVVSGPAHGSRQIYDEMKKPVAALIALQKATCNVLASDANKIMQKLGLLRDKHKSKKLNKEEVKQRDKALEKLWLLSKGMPRHKTLLQAKESPDIRDRLDKLDAFYHIDINKSEGLEKLEALELIVNEQDHSFELTDRGMKHWSSNSDDFIMLDLGQEYAKIEDNCDLNSNEKMKKKGTLREQDENKKERVLNIHQLFKAHLLMIEDDRDLNSNEKMEKKVALREQDANKKERYHNIHQLFKAHLLMINDVDYIIDNRSVIIIDENTGRPQPGRRFSDGLHQAIEAKEGVRIQEETQTYASITLQNYFRMYDRLAGMTGTAMTEAQEFSEVYKLVVQAIPSNKKNCRADHDDEVYMSEREKFQAILKDIKEIHATGQPILLGTDAVDISEKLARILSVNGLKHTVLNAKNHASEAEVIANAGQKGAITVATNMAGRGTDIKLEKGVEALGGLYVLGTTRHQSRRIDRQLRGRCARQGDRGSSKFYISFEDSLMKRFSSNRTTAMLKRFRLPEGEAISSSILNRSIETTQKRVEQRNYAMRKNTLEYDDVMNLHRKEVYDFRNQVLHEKSILRVLHQVIDIFISGIVERAFELGTNDIESRVIDALEIEFPIARDKLKLSGLKSEEMQDHILHHIKGLMNEKLHFQSHQLAALQLSSGHKINPAPLMYDVLRAMVVSVIDKYFKLHLLAIDHLRQEVHMSSIAQKDPLIEFKEKAFFLFEKFSKNVHQQICHAIFKFQVANPEMQGFESIFKQYLKKHHQMNYLNLENVSSVLDEASLIK